MKILNRSAHQDDNVLISPDLRSLSVLGYTVLFFFFNITNVFEEINDSIRDESENKL